MRVVRAGERTYALLRAAGQVYVLDNNCPHNGGPLAKGELHDCELTCPWHGWRWNVATGRSIWPGSDWCVPRYQVTVVDGEIRARLP